MRRIYFIKFVFISFKELLHFWSSFFLIFNLKTKFFSLLKKKFTSLNINKEISGFFFVLLWKKFFFKIIFKISEKGPKKVSFSNKFFSNLESCQINFFIQRKNFGTRAQISEGSIFLEVVLAKFLKKRKSM